MCQGLMKVVLLFVVGSAWAGEVYRWQDVDGKWHFGDPQGAPGYAEPFVAVVPLSVIETKKIAPHDSVDAVVDESNKGSKTKVRKNRKRKEQYQAVDVNDRERHKVHCDKWRERLYRSRLGLRDHEGQSAYERECILKVHW